MKLSKAEVRGKATLGMELRFETQNLTSYSGLILFQHFFSLIGIKERLLRCFRHLKANPIYAHHVVVMLLVATAVPKMPVDGRCEDVIFFDGVFFESSLTSIFFAP